MEHSGGACVLYSEDGKILLVKQYRYAYGETIYEIPAGKLNAGEEPALAAARELEEEAGIRADCLTLLFYDVSHSRIYERKDLYLSCRKRNAYLRPPRRGRISDGGVSARRNRLSVCWKAEKLMTERRLSLYRLTFCP